MTNQNDAYEKFLEISKALAEAEVPTENRIMYYYLWSWWRHPIKRWKQKRALKYLGENT